MSIKEDVDLQSLSSNSSDILYCSGTFELDVDLNQTQSMSTSSTLSLESDLDHNTPTCKNNNNNDNDQRSIQNKSRLTIDVSIPTDKRVYNEEYKPDDTYDDLFLDYKSSLSYDSDNEKDEDEDEVSLLNINPLLCGTLSKTEHFDDDSINDAIGEGEYSINKNFQLLYDTDDNGMSVDDFLDESDVERDYNTDNFPSLLETDDLTDEDQHSHGKAMKLDDDDDTLDLSALLEEMINDDFSDTNVQMHPWDIMFCKGRESSEGNQEKEHLLGDDLTHKMKRSFLKFELPKNSMKSRKSSRNLVDLLVHKVFEKIKSGLFEKHYVPFESSPVDCQSHDTPSNSKNGDSLAEISNKDHATGTDFVQFETNRDLWAIEETDDENYESAFPVNDVCRKLDFEDDIEPFVYGENFRHEWKVKSPVTRIANNYGQDKSLSQLDTTTNQKGILPLESQDNEYSTPMNDKLCLTYETEKIFNFDEVDSAIEVMLSKTIPLMPTIEDIELSSQDSETNHLSAVQSDKTNHTKPSYSSSILSTQDLNTPSHSLSKHFASLACKDEFTHTVVEPTEDLSTSSHSVSKLITSLACKDEITHKAVEPSDVSPTEDLSTSSHSLSKHFASLVFKDEITHKEIEPTDQSPTEDLSTSSHSISKLITCLSGKDEITTTEGDDKDHSTFTSQSVKELRAYFEMKLGLTSKSTTDKVCLRPQDKSNRKTDSYQAEKAVSGQIDISSKPIEYENDGPVLVRKKLTQAHQSPQFLFMSLRFPQSIQKHTKQCDKGGTRLGF